MRSRLLLLVLVMGLVVSACSSSDTAGVAAARPAPRVTLSQSDRSPPPSEKADVVAKVLPSVVNVRVTSEAGKGEGSGVIIQRDGIILTNAHVVREAATPEGIVEEVTIVFNDDVHEKATGTVVGAICDRDLAIIHVDENDLDPIELGRSSRLRLGDGVLAVGFPLGLGATVTDGIVSGEERTIQPVGDARLKGLLQTDAAINPGNSGGALVNLAGELVGINTATANAATAENTGFAIAIDSAVPVIEDILSSPPGDRPFLGVTYDPTADDMVISDVEDGTPADDAGLEAGDKILSMNGEDISSPDDFTSTLGSLRPGAEVEFEIETGDGDERSVTVELGSRPADLCLPEG